MTLSPACSTAVGVESLALAAVGSWSGLLLVVRGRVVPGWALSAALLVMALVLRWVLARAGRPAPTDAVRLPRKRTWRAVWVPLGTRLLIVTAVLGTAGGAVNDQVLGAEYHVLRPSGPGGCTAVVREASFLMSGGGEAYAVGRTGLALGTAGSWTVDDGYRPVASGTYTLVWGRDGGLLRISGTSTDPVVSGGSVDLDCGW
ncbi:hypothetical protein J8N05_07855 [Streptomyces sp. BH-SS-21]|uniref:Uncharacterized protein n=1 Tax=Streptomyces liliiviolaceus TaxID=2823109 RepID=A0A941B2H5_9ACTN|nr:hypothetical protein [Streptomyces liliiviolaceus]MBQ0848125.1 hypothetical protein [Streptomyces liliiviolaceus]